MLWLVVVRGLNKEDSETTQENSTAEEVKDNIDSDDDGEISDEEMSDWYNTFLPNYTTGEWERKEPTTKEDDPHGYNNLPGYVTGNN